ncbi:MAG: hypothetical protein HOE76_06445 [Euryarchaeota archaeon]|nr:hypothetical protein [Euryarchaeota archaeon]MBT4982428.1 hypothetical protein [Euryarchaeota archaeon]MBT5183753.1 hypothetical protein [Euryarchaeota archaeon]
MTEKALQTFEEIGRIPGRILKFLLSDHSLDFIDDNTSSEERLRLIKREEKLICIRAAMIGIISGLGIVWATFLATPLEPDSNSNGLQIAKYYCVIIGVGVVLTMVELVLIYIDTIRTARNIATISGIRPVMVDDSEAADELILSLMYAGLKAPNSYQPKYGINPRAYISKFFLMFSLAAHKSKVAISRVIVKSLYRRIWLRLWGRTASRGIIETASVPVFALWNFIVVRRVMQEIRIRTTVPLLMDEILERLYPDGFNNLTKQQRLACCLAIRSQVTGVADFHPNIKLFIEKVGLTTIQNEGDEMYRFGIVVKSMQVSDREVALRTFNAVCGMDGRIKKRIKNEGRKLQLLCPEYEYKSLFSWKKYFLNGKADEIN